MESYQTKAGALTGSELNIQIKKPRLGYPVSLVIDDGVPCINPLYYFQLHNGPDRRGHVHEATIPLDVLEQFVEIVQRHGVRGKFTVLPYPAGLGTLLQEWEGFDRQEVERWLAITREELVADFDITPEILTHTRALDLQSLELIPEPEHIWMESRSEAELARYMSESVNILRQVGFEPTGITQPCFFHGDRAAYSNAVLTAIRPQSANPDGTVTFYFVDFEASAPPVPPHPVVVLDREKREAVISILAYADDAFWNTQYPTGPTGVESADYYITADGQKGRLVELIEGDAWAVFVTHWQSLYANGKRHGLTGLDETAARLNRIFGPRLLWMTNGEISRYRAAEETTTFTVVDAETIQVDALFACADFTFTLPASAVGAQAIEGVEVVREGKVQPLTGDTASKGLIAHASWRQGEDGLTICFDLQAGGQSLRLRR